jgi:hypothetical protein
VYHVAHAHDRGNRPRSHVARNTVSAPRERVPSRGTADPASLHTRGSSGSVCVRNAQRFRQNDTATKCFGAISRPRLPASGRSLHQNSTLSNE